MWVVHLSVRRTFAWKTYLCLRHTLVCDSHTHSYLPVKHIYLLVRHKLPSETCTYMWDLYLLWNIYLQERYIFVFEFRISIPWRLLVIDLCIFVTLIAVIDTKREMQLKIYVCMNVLRYKWLQPNYIKVEDLK